MGPVDNKPKKDEEDKAACPVRNADTVTSSQDRLDKRDLERRNSKIPVRQISNGAWWQPAMLLGMQITGWIVGPIIAGLLLGRWLDKKFGTEPWLLLVSMVLAFVITNVGIVREGRRAQQKMEEKDKK